MKFPARQRVIVSVIKEAREAAKLSQRQLSVKLGVPINWIQRIESMERDVKLAEFIAIAKACKADPEEMYRKCLR